MIVWDCKLWENRAKSIKLSFYHLSIQNGEGKTTTNYQVMDCLMGQPRYRPPLQPTDTSPSPVPLSQFRPWSHLTRLSNFLIPSPRHQIHSIPYSKNKRIVSLYFLKTSVVFSLLINSSPTSLAWSSPNWSTSRFVSCRAPTTQNCSYTEFPVIVNKPRTSTIHTFVLSSPSNRTVTLFSWQILLYCSMLSHPWWSLSDPLLWAPTAPCSSLIISNRVSQLSVCPSPLGFLKESPILLASVFLSI